MTQPQQPIRCTREVVDERVVAVPHHLGGELPPIGRDGEQERRQPHGVMANPPSDQLVNRGDIML